MRSASRHRAASSFMVFIVVLVAAALVRADVPVTIERAEGQERTRPPVKVMGVVGDLVCDPSNPNYNGGRGRVGQCRHRAVFRLIDPRNEDRVFRPYRLIVPGDTQYDRGEYHKFFARGAYHDTFGRLKRITWPVAGNHEYKTRRASGYFDYFNGRRAKRGPAGVRGKGYYSKRIGCLWLGGEQVCTWRLLFLNTELGGARWREQLRWLNRKMRTYPESCLLAVGHVGPFSTSDHFDGVSGTTGRSVIPLWDALYRGSDEGLDASRNADLFLTGHSHAYERFLPQNDTIEKVEVDGGGGLSNPQAQLDDVAGVTHFVVGTGGESTDHEQFHAPRAPNEAFRDLKTYGVLRLQLGLRADRTAWSSKYYEVGATRGSRPRDEARRDCN